MGAQQTQHFDPTIQGWEIIDTIGGITTWEKQITGQLMEENKFMVGTQQQFNYQIDAFNFRYNSPVLVASKYLKREIKSEVCAAIYEGNLFLEKIQFRLRRVNQIPYPDIMHLYSQCFKGFSLLYKQVGPFTITEEMIGVNNHGIVKVWLNSDFASNLPEAFEATKIGEADMLKKLINMIEENTDVQTMPLQMSIYLKNKNVKTFDEAQKALIQSFQIPQRMECVLQDNGQITIDQLQTVQHRIPNNILNNNYFSNIHPVQQHFVSQQPFHQPKIMYTIHKPASVSQNTVIIPNSLNSIPTRRTQMISPRTIQPNLEIKNDQIRPKSYKRELSPKPQGIAARFRYVDESILNNTQKKIIETQRPFVSKMTLNSNPPESISQATILRSTPYNISTSKSPVKTRKPAFEKPSPLFHFANKPRSPSPLINKTTLKDKQNNLKRNASTISHHQNINNYSHNVIQKNNNLIKRQPSQPIIINTEAKRATSPLSFANLKHNINNNDNILRENYHQQKSLTGRITSPQFAEKLISQNNTFRQRSTTPNISTRPNIYPTPSKATQFKKIQQTITPVQIQYVQQKGIVSEQPTIKYNKPTATYHEASPNLIQNINFQNRYQLIQQESDKTSQQIMNLIRDSRKIKLEQQKINENNTNISFTVQRFAPTVNQIFVNKKQQQTNIPQLAGSGYISSLYIPLHIHNASEHVLLPSHSPYCISNATQDNSQARQSYEPPRSTYSTYTYQNNQSRNNQQQKSNFSPIKYDQQMYGGASYAKSNGVSQYLNIEYKQQCSTPYQKQVGIGYEGIDAELLRDLQRMRANLPLNR